MRCEPCSSDHHFEAALFGRVRILGDELWRAMRRRDLRIIRDAELIQNLASRLHRLPVVLGAHQNCNQRLSGRLAHGLIVNQRLLIACPRAAGLIPAGPRRDKPGGSPWVTSLLCVKSIVPKDTLELKRLPHVARRSAAIW